MHPLRMIVPAALAGALLIAGVFSIDTVQAADMDPAAVSKRIAETYGVKVLRVKEGDQDGKRVYLVTVMNAGGDFNEAFQVNTLAVDPATGALISQFRYTPTGHIFSGGGDRSPNVDASGTTIRQRSGRNSPQ